MKTVSFSQKHLIGIDQWADAEIQAALDRAQFYADHIAADTGYSNDTLRGRRVLNLFFENSTRTRASFDMAARRLGAEAINLDIATSSVKKGETLMDTVATMAAIVRPDAIVMRHSEYGAPGYVAPHVKCPVINAGDSWREHPTQALLDALTIIRRKGGIAGRTIAICGDIAHSRVANSNMILLTRLGANVRVIAPPALVPQKFPVAGVRHFETMEDGLPGCDIVMMLRLQKERMQAGLIESESDYFKHYGLTPERLALAGRDADVMHPGPMNRGVEIADEVADDPQRSLILEQVRNGVPARMAVLELLIGARA
ncbi:MAG: aspartate carbamoyltransferase catalytic subunit [Alphaproteobacteria bacterium]|nr:aspartate carbamoyltransferase catalytic subunit [Alphaproteobacteria bacterium]MBU0859370.1 aspartate carbamoyltransferase catalytic subunit [Alphaproteobacteria bacterium]